MPRSYTTAELLSRLVSFDTTSRNSNLELAQFVGDYLDGYGVRPGHSSKPAAGVNAIEAAAEAITWVTAQGRRFALEGPFEQGYDPPHTTTHVGLVQGGTSLNMIPEQAEFLMEWRVIAATDTAVELE